MEAAGATAVEANAIRNGFVYEAENGKFIRLDLNQNSWSSFDSFAEAHFGRTYAEGGSSSLADLGSTLGLFAGVEAGAGLAVRLGAAVLGRMFGLEIASLGLSGGAAGATSVASKAATGAADGTAKWIVSQNKGVAKSIRQMSQRGWTPTQVTEAIKGGQQFPATNFVNKGNPAIRYVHPKTGQSVVQDTVTKEIIHFGGPGFKY